MRQLLLVTVMTLTTACASGAWVRPAGLTDSQVRRDAYECQRDAASTGSAWTGAAGQVQEHMRARELAGACMSSKGYRWDRAAVAATR